MSIAVPAISGNLKLDFNNTSINLFKNFDYVTIYEFIGYGNLHSTCFKVSGEKVLLKFYRDELLVTELDIRDYAQALNFGNTNTILPIIFDINEKTIYLKFDYPIHFSKSIRFEMKSNENRDNSVDAQVIILTKDSEK